MRDFMKLNHLLSIDGDEYILVDNVDHYEVYTHTSDYIFGGYLGDFSSIYDLGTPEFEANLSAWLKGEVDGDEEIDDTDATIKWFKVKSSLYEQTFAIKLWKDVVDFVTRHVCFDVSIEGQTAKTPTGVDAEYKDGEFHVISSDFTR